MTPRGFGDRSATERDLAPREVPTARDRTAARGKFLRAATRLALAAAAVGLVAFAAHSRALGARLDALSVVPGETPEAAPDPSAPGPFAPFSFGIVGPVRGDASSLESAVESLAAEGAAFVVLVGDVTDDGSASEVRRLALACRDRGPAVVAVPGSRDVDCPEFETLLCAQRWWFRHRDVLVVGVPGSGADDPTWLRERLGEAGPAHSTFVVSSEPASISAVAGSATVLGPDARARLVEVGAVGVSVRDVPVPRGPSPGAWVRGVALLVEPLVRSNAAHFAVLVIAAAALYAAIRGARARRPLAAV